MFVWWCTFGGYLGFGALRDFFKIPYYVQDVNESQQYIKSLTEKMKNYKKVSNKTLVFIMLLDNT